MVRETVYKCDNCGAYAGPADTTQALFRKATDTTQNYRNGADLCPSCVSTVTVGRVQEIAASIESAPEAVPAEEAAQ
jgi:DNA-directed RNA polymerase subunit RPC12/RpoP